VTEAPLAVALEERVPQELVEQETVQVTPLLLGSLATVPVNCWVVVATTVADCGSVSTVIAGTVTVAEAEPKGFATEVAVMVTLTSLTGRGGAV